MAEYKLTKNNFDTEINNTDIPILVDFWAGWCGPCKMLSPVISEIAEEYEGKIKVCKVNVDEEAELAQKYNISSIPALLVFKNGKLTSSDVGFMPKNSVLQLVNK